MKDYSTPSKWPGDAGKTRMLGTHELDKDSLFIEATGTVDELNSFVGLAIDKIENKQILDTLKGIQADLFTIGAELAGSPRRDDKQTHLEPEHVVKLEEHIYRLDRTLKPLSSFILPGGTADAALLHVCRSICRRAERRVVSLKKERIVNDDIIKYLNRLSYLFFLFARQINEGEGVHDQKW